MSRILRRPMFRGGPVDSRGTGITSGLDDGYMDGGRVEFQRGGFSTIPGIDDLSQIGIYNPFTGFSAQNITPLQRRQQDIATANRRGIFAPTEEQLYERNRPRTPKQFEEAVQKGLEITRSKPFETSDESFPPRKAMEEPNKGGAGTGEKSDIDLLSADEKEITKQAKLYEKLLGGEEARAQAGYDALLAAAPAFFKGKNLREAAPQVLESINKSGAFDKPRDIKQAAAQLAIQRRLLMDKAGAEEKQRLAILSMKNQKDVFDVLKDQQIPIGSYLGSYETANREGGPGVLLNKYYLTNNNVLVRIDKGKDGQLIPTALGKI
jgi:hypothetical protein